MSSLLMSAIKRSGALHFWQTISIPNVRRKSSDQEIYLEVFLGLSCARSVGTAGEEPAARAAGGFATLAAMTALTATVMESRAESTEGSPIFEGSHLLAVPFDVPPGLFVKRWLVVNTPADPTLGCLTNLVLTYELADKSSHRVALSFRNTNAPSEWQANVCAPEPVGREGY